MSEKCYRVPVVIQIDAEIVVDAVAPQDAKRQAAKTSVDDFDHLNTAIDVLEPLLDK